MNKLFAKTLCVLYRVFFIDSNKGIEQLPEVSLEHAGQIVLKVHPKGHYMQLKSYRKDGQSEFDIDMHDHNEDDKDYTHNGIHIHEYKLTYIKKFKAYKYKRQKGRDLTDEEYKCYIEDLNIENLTKIHVGYID